MPASQRRKDRTRKLLAQHRKRNVTNHEGGKETVSGSASPVQPASGASRLQPDWNPASPQREVSSDTGTHHNSHTGPHEIGSSNSPVLSAPRVPAPKASSSRNTGATNTRSTAKYSMALITAIAILAIVLVKLITFVGTAHAKESDLSSSTAKLTGPIIAVMSVSGTGKSSLIRDLQGRDIKGCLPNIGHGLESCKQVF